jgi:hypothetical protein
VTTTNATLAALLTTPAMTRTMNVQVPEDIKALLTDVKAMLDEVERLKAVADAARHLVAELRDGDDLGVGVWETRTKQALDACQT